MDCDYDGENAPEASPISGMDAETFHSLMLEDSVQFRMDQEDIAKQLESMGAKGVEGVKKMKVGKS